MNTTELIEAIRALLPNTIAIYIFGSTGTAYERPDSDLDIAILADQKISFETKLALMNPLMKISHKDRIDIVDLYKAPPLLKAQIIFKGKLIYSANKLTVNLFEDRSLLEYVFFNEERRELVNDILKRGSVYGR